MIERIDLRQCFNGVLKALLFVAFYVAGVMTNSQLSEYTIVTQKERIEYLENETAIQRLQINELNKKAAENSENLKKLENIQSVIETIKKDISYLKGQHNESKKFNK